jgi:RimJ/RimL family protein N-acetyltransferase
MPRLTWSCAWRRPTTSHRGRRDAEVSTGRLDLVPVRSPTRPSSWRCWRSCHVHVHGRRAARLDELRRRFGRLVVGRSDDGSEAWHNWVVRRRDDGRAVGVVQATVRLDRPEAEVAGEVGVPWQSRGYATEAARALVAWLDEAGVTTVVALVHPDHAASAAVARKAGLDPTDVIEDGERVWRRPT